MPLSFLPIAQILPTFKCGRNSVRNSEKSLVNSGVNEKCEWMKNNSAKYGEYDKFKRLVTVTDHTAQTGALFHVRPCPCK